MLLFGGIHYFSSFPFSISLYFHSITWSIFLIKLSISSSDANIKDAPEQKRSTVVVLLELPNVNEYIRHRSNNIIYRIVSSIRDTRNPDFVVHSMQSLVTQRVCQIAAGYEDADDCDRLRGDVILKMCCGRTPDDETDLAPHPTMTRL